MLRNPVTLTSAFVAAIVVLGAAAFIVHVKARPAAAAVVATEAVPALPASARGSRPAIVFIPMPRPAGGGSAARRIPTEDRAAGDGPKPAKSVVLVAAR